MKEKHPGCSRKVVRETEETNFPYLPHNSANNQLGNSSIGRGLK